MTTSQAGLVFDRIVRVLKEIRPGAQFPVLGNLPGGHREIVTDIKGRVYPQVMGALTHKDGDGLPAIDVSRVDEPTTTEYQGADLEFRRLPLVVIGYAGDPSGGSALNFERAMDHKRVLENFSADIQVAMASVNWWTGPGEGENLQLRQLVGEVGINQARSDDASVYYRQSAGEVALFYNVDFMALERAA